MRRFALVLVALIALLLPATSTPASAASCSFVLGFKTLHDLIPQQVGDCLDNETYGANGDSLQHTTGGLLVWRKADNWTAFTDGYHTWINGPYGLAERLNTQRFSWEANPDHLPLADASLAPIVVRQPQPYDLVDNPVQVAGIGTGFEGTFAARIRDANGTELVRRSITAGGSGIWGNFQTTLPLSTVPATAQGTLEIFDVSAKDGSEINKVTVPITFGTALVQPYHGFAQYTVAAGDTLRSIAQHWYGDPNLWTRVWEANKQQVPNPQQLSPGQMLRVPQ